MSFFWGQTIPYPIGFEGFEDALPAKVINLYSNFVYPATLSEGSTWFNDIPLLGKAIFNFLPFILLIKNFGSRPGMYSRAVEWDTYSLPQQCPTSLSHRGTPQITHLLHQAAASKLSPAICLACCKAGGAHVENDPSCFCCCLEDIDVNFSLVIVQYTSCSRL